MLRDSAELGEWGALPETKVDRDRQRALGIYYTPPEAAKVLARWVIRHPEEIVLEPSFGGCSMLSAAVNVFKSLGNDHPSKQLYGYDVDAAAFVHLAEIGIDNVDGHFKKLDFLRSSAENIRVDAVLANPPFVSYHRMDDNHRQLTEQLRQRYLPLLPKKASLWAYFLLHSLSFLRTGGRMAFVLPNAIGTADYARPLLTFLRQRFSQVELIHVSERLFIQSGADERISLLFLSGYDPDGMLTPAPLHSRDIVYIKEIAATDDSAVQLAEHPKIVDVRDEAAAALAGLAIGNLCELGSVASIRIGEVVGDVRFFVRPLSEWLKLKVDQKYLKPLLTRSGQVRGCYVPMRANQEESLSVPFLLLPPEQCLPNEIEAYLAQYSEHAVATNKTFGKRPIWHRCSYAVDADAFIGSMSHDYPRIIGNDAGISCSNAFYKILVQERPELAAWLPILSLTTPLRLSAEILGRVRGSGGIKLEPSDVKKLCIPIVLPQLAAAEFEALRQRINKMLVQGEVDAASQLADSQVFLQPGLIEVQTMHQLRLMRLSLTSYRLTTPKRDT